MTFIFKLDLDIVKVHTYTEIWVHRSNGSAVRVLTDEQTDTQTDRYTERQTGPILLHRPLTREVIIGTVMKINVVLLQVGIPQI